MVVAAAGANEGDKGTLLSLLLSFWGGPFASLLLVLVAVVSEEEDQNV